MTRPAIDTVYILGAGFSKAAFEEMPLADELGRAVAARMGRRPGHDPDQEAFWDGVRSRGLEAYLSDLAERYPHQSEERWYWSQQLLARSLPLIADEIIEIQRRCASQSVVAWWLKPLLDLMNHSGSGIVTFNYDTMVEAHWPWAWDMPDERLGAYPSEAGSPQQANHATPWKVPTSADVALFKLHGSVNWLASPLDQHGLTLRQDAADLRLPHHLSDEGFRASGALEPVIVPPTNSKSVALQRSFMAALWKQALQRLRRASRVVLIGYSLPETDRAAAALLRDGRTPTSGGLVVVDRDADQVAQRILRLGIDNHEVRTFSGARAVSEFVKAELLHTAAGAVLDPSLVKELMGSNLFVCIESPDLRGGVLALNLDGQIVAQSTSLGRTLYAEIAKLGPQPNSWEIRLADNTSRVLPVLDVRVTRTDRGSLSTLTLICGRAIDQKVLR
ncbi:MAG: hypothetical protein CVT68_02395 [Actinobacteria bacterium HGW-Actinobacteria-8]|nr:MAG: hypothetical protein CVT68_02395 [Actinobacteria bacterium HGW-Actinobacteria-8]